MPRYKPSEYRTEKRAKDKPFAQQQTRCEGLMGLCEMPDVKPCNFCQRPFCTEDMRWHLTRCRGMR